MSAFSNVDVRNTSEWPTFTHAMLSVLRSPKLKVSCNDTDENITTVWHTSNITRDTIYPRSKDVLECRSNVQAHVSLKSSLSLTDALYVPTFGEELRDVLNRQSDAYSEYVAEHLRENAALVFSDKRHPYLQKHGIQRLSPIADTLESTCHVTYPTLLDPTLTCTLTQTFEYNNVQGLFQIDSDRWTAIQIDKNTVKINNKYSLAPPHKHGDFQFLVPDTSPRP